MRFRPCIDIHNGRVKQIVGSTLKDEGDMADENFVSERDAKYYAGLYRDKGLFGGHIILLNSVTSKYYEETKRQAISALREYDGGMQIGGGINDENAPELIKAGASHVIVTSYVFQGGRIDYDNLKRINAAVGRDRLVLDVSCKKKDEEYYIVTDRWQKFTDEILRPETLDVLSQYCDEFLIHAVDVEGKSAGIDERLVKLLGEWSGIPITYAGGIKSFEDIGKLKKYGNGRIDFTVGSALDIFGGNLAFEKIVELCD